MLYWTHNTIKIPKLGFGTWKLENQEAVEAVTTALEEGYRHIDTASIYSNEKQVGQALKDVAIPREDLFLTTKIWRDYLSKDLIFKEAQKSLKNLKLDYLDLLLIHWPHPNFPLEQSLQALEALVKNQQVRLIGVSNFPCELLLKARKISPSLITNQVEYHPFLSQTPLLEVVQKQRMFLTAYSSLARAEAVKSQQLQHIAQKYNKSTAQIVLRWLVEQTNVVSLVKSKNKKHIKDNFNIFDFQLEKKDQDKIYRLTHQKRRCVDPPFAPQWDE
ncbi:MAG: aldo/keto reductase [Bdellovibrionales bacterium]